MAFLYNLHRADPSAWSLFSAHARNIGYGIEMIQALDTGSPPLVETVNVHYTVAICADSMLNIPGMVPVQYKKELDIYLHGVAVACGRLGADAGEQQTEEVWRRLVMATAARLFLLSLAVAVGQESPACLASWLDPRCHRVTAALAAEGVPSEPDSSVKGRLFSPLCTLLGPENLHNMFQEAEMMQPWIAFAGFEHAATIEG